MSSKRILFLVEVAIFTALAYMLDIIPFLSFKIWAFGGSISLAMIPVFIVAFRWGIKGGLLAGFLWGMLQMAIGPNYILHPIQGILDYPAAFTVLGFAGVFANRIQTAVKSGDKSKYLMYIMFGVLLGSMLRFISHYFAGVFFFESAIEGVNVWVYSLLYNVSYIIPSFIICTIAVFLLFHKQPKTLVQQTA
ncbi:energy-coupled thiamine transporter ThiT [Virgibacillus doumboii]|uniref:energy-coupled thiamine transporter ThiT n=1 Tax=Virgibacillus doumboii TaxID=2697503 RepID=UPI0013DF65F3|nr:energy-coupled thiamine transporter ThiT [Virgibacillus doumboii]